MQVQARLGRQLGSRDPLIAPVEAHPRPPTMALPAIVMAVMSRPLGVYNIYLKVGKRDAELHRD